VEVPGVVDEDRGLAIHSVNLGWRDVPVRHMLEQRVGAKVGFGHDVRAGALAEVRLGVAAGREGVVAFIPVGTGVAAALLHNGETIVSGGWAGEIGQALIPSGEFAGCRVEEIASATGTARRAGLPDARTVALRVATGDPAAAKVWQQTVDVLADAIAAMTAVVAQNTVIIGGGLALAGNTLLDPLARAISDRVKGLRTPILCTAILGDRAGALGATLLAADLQERE
jgi:glucokinase